LAKKAIQKRPGWEIVAHRWRQWQSFEKASRCTFCRVKNVEFEEDKSDIRTTPIGDVCLSCYFDRETCEVCGLGPVVCGESHASALEFQGKKVCADCLVPEVPLDAWNNWLLFYVYSPASSFAQVLADASAEEFERSPGRYSRRALRRVMEIEWPILDSVHGWYGL
jgi:hypothetical protein